MASGWTEPAKEAPGFTCHWLAYANTLRHRPEFTCVGDLNAFSSGRIEPGDNDNNNARWFGGDIDEVRWQNETLAGAVAAVPEPSTYAFLGLGTLGLGCVTYRRKKKQVA